MTFRTNHEPLALPQRNWRLALLAGGALGALLLRSADPVRAGSFLPFPTSCGAITGLPCVLCGATRGIHHLLNGEWSRALYFNWLSYPLLAWAAIAAAIFAIELITGRRQFTPYPQLAWTGRNTGIAIALLMSLWIFHATVAVKQHKRELLNPRGPLYAVFVR